MNPLLLVDRCESCGGVWLDANELKLVKKLLGISDGDTEVKVSRPDPEAVIAHREPVKSPLIKIVSGICALAGLVGISVEMYFYFSPATAVSRAPSMGLLVLGILLFVGGVFGLLRRK